MHRFILAAFCDFKFLFRFGVTFSVNRSINRSPIVIVSDFVSAFPSTVFFFPNFFSMSCYNLNSLPGLKP